MRQQDPEERGRQARHPLGLCHGSSPVTGVGSTM
jgi:hypothetical protein